MSAPYPRHPVSPQPAVRLDGSRGSQAGLHARGRALPIVVAAGLGMGVFAGLVVVRGTGKIGADTRRQVSLAVATALPVATAMPAAAAQARPKTGLGPKTGPGPKTGLEPRTGLGSLPDTDAAPWLPPSQPASQVTPSSRVAVVSFSVRPRRAHIFVNGTELEGTSTDIPLVGGSARIQVTIKSHGYKTHNKAYPLIGDEQIVVALRRERRDEPTGPGALLDIR